MPSVFESFTSYQTFVVVVIVIVVVCSLFSYKQNLAYNKDGKLLVLV
jgi:hypothetical protein